MIDRTLLDLPGMPKALAALLLSALLQAACILGQAYSLSTAIVNMWLGEPAAEQLLPLAVFFACYVGAQLVLFVQKRLLDSFAYGQAARLRRQLLQRIFTSRTRVVRDGGTAAVTQSVLEGADQVETYCKLLPPKLVGMMSIPLVILIAVSIGDIMSGVILLMMFPAIIFFMVLLGKTAKAKAESQYGAFRRMSNHFIDTLRGIDTLIAFGVSARERGRIFRTSEQFRIATMDTMKVATLSGAVLDMCTVFGIGAVAIMLGLRLADGSMQLAVALPILVMAPEYFRPIREFASDFHASLDGKNALEHILQMIDGDEGAREAELESAEPPLDAIAPWSSDSTLSLEGVSFGYAPDDLALQDISLRVRGFAKIGIVGTSGAGKSTLVNLLGGFEQPCGGSMRIDGQDVASLGLDSWQRQALYIPQDPYLFCATLRDNIAFYTPDATDEQVERAIQVVGLQELADHLPQGLDTVIGEGARGLSGGQAQRIALARALLDPKRKVLLFDEPTAHLDIETELELKGRMLPCMDDRLVFFATHRLHWLADMDYILVLEEGHVAEEGTLEQLMARDGKLAELARNMNAGLDGCMPSASLAGAETTCAQSEDAAALETAAASSISASIDPPACDLASEGRDVPAGSSDPSALETGASPDSSAKAGESAAGERDASTSCAPEIPPAQPDAVIAENAHRSSASAFPGFDRWVKPYFRLYRSQMAKALLLGLVTFACSALLMYTAGFLISWTSDPALPTLAAIMYSVGFVQIFGLGRPISRYFERLAIHDWVFRMTSNLRARLFRIAEARGMETGRERMGDFLGLLVEDIGHLQNLFLRTIFPTAIAWILGVAATCFFGAFDLRAAAGMLAVAVIACVVMPHLALRANRSRIQLRKELRNQLYTELTDNVLGAADWVFAGRGNDYLQRYTCTQERAHAAQLRVERYGHLNDLVEGVVFGIGAVAVVLWAGMHFASGHIGGTSNWIAAFALGFFPVVEAFAPIAGDVSQVNNHTDALRRLDALPREADADPIAQEHAFAGTDDEEACAPPATREHTDEVACIDDDAMHNGEAPEGKAFGKNTPDTGSQESGQQLAGTPGLEETPTIRDSARLNQGSPIGQDAGPATVHAPSIKAMPLSIRDVSYAYLGETLPALSGVTVNISAGQKVAILGPSGAGKSTLAGVMRGDLEPSAGDALVGDDPVSTIRQDMHRYIGLVQQRTYLFNRTLRDNLTLGRDDISDDDIWEALGRVRMEAVAERLPEGLDTLLEEAGGRFSGGERHRLAFARVLLADTPIVLLDEPMVGLDPLVEHDLIDTLLDACAEKTLVMITHHLQDIARFDRVIFVEGGRIALDGSPAQLAAASPRFQRLLAFDRGV